MKNEPTFLYGILLIVPTVVFLYLAIRYTVSIKKNLRQSRQAIENFLYSLANSFQEERWDQLHSHHIGNRSCEEIAYLIHKKIKIEMRAEFTDLCSKIYGVYPDFSGSFGKDSTSQKFLEKMKPVLAELCQEHSKNKTPIPLLYQKFLEKTKEVILCGLQETKKWQKKHTLGCFLRGFFWKEFGLIKNYSCLFSEKIIYATLYLSVFSPLR